MIRGLLIFGNSQISRLSLQGAGDFIPLVRRKCFRAATHEAQTPLPTPPEVPLRVIWPLFGASYVKDSWRVRAMTEGPMHGSAANEDEGISTERRCRVAKAHSTQYWRRPYNAYRGYMVGYRSSRYCLPVWVDQRRNGNSNSRVETACTQMIQQPSMKEYARALCF